MHGQSVRHYSGGHCPGVVFLLDQFLKPYLLRKWLGVALVAAGAVGCVVAGQTRLLGFDLGLVPVFAVAIGIGLFMKGRRFEQVD